MLGTDGKYPGSTKRNLLTFVRENFKNSALKHFIEIPILLNFVTLSAIFSAKLWNPVLVKNCPPLLTVLTEHLFS